jgi:hypothetical protein
MKFGSLRIKPQRSSLWVWVFQVPYERCFHSHANFVNSEHWRVASLKLDPLDGAGYWVYEVRFDFVPPTSGKDNKESMTIPVMMNGVAIEPKKIN